MRRLFWKAAYCWCLLAHHVFGASYKWVNVGRGAWHPELYNPLWHFEWYGTQIKEIPYIVTLGGMGYRTADYEGLVQFKSDDYQRLAITYERDPHDPHCHLWYVTVEGKLPASHVEESHRWVKARYGGSFEKRK